jgi:hypothetical protein
VWARPPGADRIVLVGVALWVLAQDLPAYTHPGLFGDPHTVPGFMATLLAWMDGVFAFDHDPAATLAILVAWSANIWLAAGLVCLALHHGGGALVLAVVAAGCAAVGLWVLLEGGFPEIYPFATVTVVGVGSWVWFASILVVVAGLVPLPSRLRSAG